jgi:hypothetical protein
MKTKQKSVLFIDKFKLDEECAEQPDAYVEFAVAAAQAEYDADTYKHRLEVAKAEAELEIRREPKKFGIIGVKEASVKAAVVLHPRVQKATRLLNVKKRDAKVIRDRVVASGQRKGLIEKLCDMDARQYFSKPRSSLARERAEDEEFRRRSKKK